MMNTDPWSRSVRQWTDLRYSKFCFPRRRDSNSSLTCLILGPPYGFGRHKAALSDEQIETFMMVNLRNPNHSIIPLTQPGELYLQSLL